ncbi:MAG TPA: HAD hydrolase-like protein, partial [Blastocatellia bacterium]|nr:HAD hydrolase-like protein [Blastocatellia bacterium]
PEPLYVAIDECGAQRSLSVMVGDGETDIRAGKAAGIRTVAVTYGFRDAAALAPLAPDAVIDSMTELVPALWPSTN